MLCEIVNCVCYTRIYGYFKIPVLVDEAEDTRKGIKRRLIDMREKKGNEKVRKNGERGHESE